MTMIRAVGAFTDFENATPAIITSRP
jgi:hypothetical protein